MTASKMGRSSRHYRSRDDDDYYSSAKRRRVMKYGDDYSNGYDVKKHTYSCSYDKHSER